MTPKEISNKIIELAESASNAGNRLTEIELIKPAMLIDMRKTHASDKSAEREWATTQYGQEEIKLRATLKYNSMLISAFKTKLRVMDLEARNQY